MLPAVTSVSGLLGADNTDAIAPFAQLMPTLAGNIATASEFVYDPHVPTFSESTFAAIILLFHGREKLIQKRDNFFERPNITATPASIAGVTRSDWSMRPKL